MPLCTCLQLVVTFSFCYPWTGCPIQVLQIPVSEHYQLCRTVDFMLLTLKQISLHFFHSTPKSIYSEKWKHPVFSCGVIIFDVCLNFSYFYSWFGIQKRWELLNFSSKLLSNWVYSKNKMVKGYTTILQIDFTLLLNASQWKCYEKQTKCKENFLRKWKERGEWR